MLINSLDGPVRPNAWRGPDLGSGDITAAFPNGSSAAVFLGTLAYAGRTSPIVVVL